METLQDEEPLQPDVFTKTDKSLSTAEEQRLLEQNKRLVTPFKAQQLEKFAQRNWDLFYKRNETRFFKDRRWTTREFEELLNDENSIQNSSGDEKPIRRLLEVGCGVGNLIYPLIEEEKIAGSWNTYYYACDFSPRAIEFVRAHTLYDEKRLHAFQCDITSEDVHDVIPSESLDIVTMIFVLSAIHPDKFTQVLENLMRLLKPGGVVLFRDYGLYDMAQLRFKPGNKIADNLYVRQDGTRSYYFSERELGQMFINKGFEVLSNAYVHRRTRNVKEGIDVPRVFIQGKFRKKNEKR